MEFSQPRGSFFILSFDTTHVIVFTFHHYNLVFMVFSTSLVALCSWTMFLDEVLGRVTGIPFQTQRNEESK